MKIKHPVSGKHLLFPGAAAMLLAALLLFACNKSNDARPSQTDTQQMATAAKAVAGDIAWGKVTTALSEEGVLLHVNDLDILIERRPGNGLSGLPDMPSAAVVTSPYGLVVKDLETGRLYFLVNNDTESIRHFNALASLLPPAEKNDLIFGTTIVRSSKS